MLKVSTRITMLRQIPDYRGFGVEVGVRYGNYSSKIQFASSLFSDGSLDFVYIDANHSKEAVSQDIELWWPKVKNGGFFGGHDYFEHFNPIEGKFGVVEAVDEFMKKNKLEFMVTSDIPPSWYVIK